MSSIGNMSLQTDRWNLIADFGMIRKWYALLMILNRNVLQLKRIAGDLRIRGVWETFGGQSFQILVRYWNSVYHR